MRSVQKNLVTAVLMTIVTTIILGLVYPLVVTGLAQVIFPDKANGQLIRNAEGTVIGSRLIGQPFTSPGYFLATVSSGRERLRREWLRRLKPWPNQSEAYRSCKGRRREVAARESR